MLPAQVILLDALPLTPSGKLDRKAPPAVQGQGGSGRAPEGPTERMLAALYAEILALPQPADAETDFFLAGGDSLRAVARSLRIEEAQPDGPLTLLGWSLGWIIAHAMAAEAERRGREVAQLVLLDAYPSDCWRDEPEPDETAALRALLAIAGFDPDAHAELDSRAAILGFLKAAGHPLGQVPRAVQDGVIRSLQATNALVRGDREPHVRAPLLLVGALRDQAGTARRAGPWQPFAGSVESLELDCRHPDLIATEFVKIYVSAMNQGVARSVPVASGAR